MRAYERMLNYVKINTESAEGTGTSPSTQRQWDLVRLPEREMGGLGLEEELPLRGKMAYKETGSH